MIVANKFSNVFHEPGIVGMRPFSARSILLSVLLGTNPPRLSIAAIMDLAELFAVPGGTMRTALSRMVAAGELNNDGGVYSLGGRMLDRQREQDEGRVDPRSEWTGEWLTAVVVADRRTVAQRRRFRSSMIGLRLGELRPDIWLRPHNLGPGVVERIQSVSDTLTITGVMAGFDSCELARRIWPLEDLARQGSDLMTAVGRTASAFDAGDPACLPNGFAISAAVVRFLRAEPQLPPALEPADWPAHDLRRAYDDYERRFQSLLGEFLRSSRFDDPASSGVQ